jgi:hypothetical protein
MRHPTSDGKGFGEARLIPSAGASADMEGDRKGATPSAPTPAAVLRCRSQPARWAERNAGRPGMATVTKARP